MIRKTRKHKNIKTSWEIKSSGATLRTMVNPKIEIIKMESRMRKLKFLNTKTR